MLFHVTSLWPIVVPLGSKPYGKKKSQIPVSVLHFSLGEVTAAWGSNLKVMNSFQPKIQTFLTATPGETSIKTGGADVITITCLLRQNSVILWYVTCLRKEEKNYLKLLFQVLSCYQILW